MVGVATVLTVVTREDLAAASALNGIEFNVGRAVGPAFWLGPSTHVPGMRAHALLRQLAEPPCDERC